MTSVIPCLSEISIRTQINGTVCTRADVLGQSLRLNLRLILLVAESCLLALLFIHHPHDFIISFPQVPPLLPFTSKAVSSSNPFLLPSIIPPPHPIPSRWMCHKNVTYQHILIPKGMKTLTPSYSQNSMKDCWSASDWHTGCSCRSTFILTWIRL